MAVITSPDVSEIVVTYLSGRFSIQAVTADGTALVSASPGRDESEARRWITDTLDRLAVRPTVRDLTGGRIHLNDLAPVAVGRPQAA